MGRRAGHLRYLPAEDTSLLTEALVEFSGGACLEIGFGSGVVLASVSGRFELAAGTDLESVQEARHARRPNLHLVLADRATCFRDGAFDLVFFNPPYLPSPRIEDRAVDGGPTGVEVPISFLEEALRVLKRGGSIVALLSEEGEIPSFIVHCQRLGLAVEEVASMKLFYEALRVFRIRRVAPRA